ncbi:MAG TPA: hypothetical protein DIT99_25050, partial [Candidatus Latescibacteria bacterium]|nr:hypothetical protein [Candidatus Latescibacterota bacterium]
KCIQIFQDGLTSASDDPELWFYLGYAHTLQKDYDQAIDITEQAVEKFTENHRLRFLLGQSYDQSGQFNKAVSTFEIALEIDPDDPFTLNY